MDNLGRDMERAMMLLLGIAFLGGGALGAVIIWAVKWWGG